MICRKATVALPDANYLSPWCQSPLSEHKIGIFVRFSSKFFPMVVLRGSLQGTKEVGNKKNRAQRKLCTEESVLETGIEPVRTFLPTGF